jgi:hypothetical protein
VPRLVTRLVASLIVDYSGLIVDYFASAARPGASARRAARRRLLRLRRVSGCLGMSRGSSSTTSPPPRVRVPRHVTRLVVDYFASARASGCLGTSHGSSSTTSPSPRIRVPRHVTRLIMPLVVDYSASRRLIVDYSASPRLVVDYSVRRDFVLRPR